MSRLLCLLGLHAWPRWVNAHDQAPRPITCERGCGKEYR